MKKSVLFIFLISITICLTSCSVRFPRYEPRGVWICEEYNMTFDFNEGISTDDNNCTIQIDGKDYSFTDVEHIWGEDTIWLGEHTEYIVEEFGTNFIEEMHIEYEIDGDKLIMYIIDSIYDEYPDGARLEFAYTGEGKGFVLYPPLIEE